MSQADASDAVDLFLCHSGVDKPWVERLGAAVERQKWGDRPLSVFLDKWDIPGCRASLLVVIHRVDGVGFSDRWIA